MLTKIEDLEELPKVITKEIDYYELYIFVTRWNKLCLVYERHTLNNRKTLCGVVVQGNRIEINDDIDHVGSVTTITEAVNMLYEYISNNKDIKVYA